MGVCSQKLCLFGLLTLSLSFGPAEEPAHLHTFAAVSTSAGLLLWLSAGGAHYLVFLIFLLMVT